MNVRKHLRQYSGVNLLKFVEDILYKGVEELNGKKLYQTHSVKYFGIHLYECLTWKHQINNVAIKIKKANARVVPRKSFLSQKNDHFLLIILF